MSGVQATASSGRVGAGAAEASRPAPRRLDWRPYLAAPA